MDKERAKDLLMNLLERAKSTADRTFLTSREIEALSALLGDDAAGIVEVNAEAVASPMAVASYEDLKSYKLLLDLGGCEIEDPACIVCVDFGTSFSKAFATRTVAGKTEFIELPIGDGKSGSSLTSPSELLLAGDQIYFGSKARKHVDDTQTSTEAIIDSIKQFITLGEEVSKLGAARLPPAQDVTACLTQRDVLVLYLAHLMHLTEAALANAGLSKNLSRRFAHPAWKDQVKDENTREMKRLMAEAIVLARSIGDDIADAIPLSSGLSLLGQLKTLSNDLLPLALIGEPVREATAAGAGALLSTSEGTRQAYLILDVGAGTTDVAGFFCVNNPDWDHARVFEITAAAGAIKKAGNLLDQYLHKYIMDRSSLTQGTMEYRSAALDVRRQRRTLKEQLFTDGRLVVPLPTDETVEVDLKTFLQYPPVQGFSTSLYELVAQSAAVIAGDGSRIKLVATGGGSRLPFIQMLADTGVTYGQKLVKFDLVDAMPSALAESSPGLSEAFPQIAVAFGGSLPDLPEQRPSVPTGIIQAPKRMIAAMYKS